MPARTGQQYIQGLKDRPPALYLRGEKVEDATTHPGLTGGIKTVARLYDLQHDPAAGSEMTYTSPTTGDPVGLSFITPKTAEDLLARHKMMAHWARVSCGMMGRTPDFLNVSMMAMAAAGDYFGEDRPEFKKNIQDYYEYVRENDLVLTHTLVNLQRNRAPQAQLGGHPAGPAMLADHTEIALSVVKETDAGIVVNGARLLATLPIADEIAVYPARSHRLPTGAPGRTSFAFAIPCDAPGLKFLCRESFDLGRSAFDHPLGSRFEEMDALAFFDNVFVPWERVFLLGDPDRCNNMSRRTHQYLHSGHQVVTKNVVKCEFVLGLGQPDAGGSRLGAAAANAPDDRRDHREPGDHQGILEGGRGRRLDGRVGSHVPGGYAADRGPAALHPHVSQDGGDVAANGFQQSDGPAHRGRPLRPDGGPHQELPRYRNRVGGGTGTSVPPGVGHLL